MPSQSALSELVRRTLVAVIVIPKRLSRIGKANEARIARAAAKRDEIHKRAAAGQSQYRISKETGYTPRTVRRYFPKELHEQDP